MITTSYDSYFKVDHNSLENVARRPELFSRIIFLARDCR